MPVPKWVYAKKMAAAKKSGKGKPKERKLRTSRWLLTLNPNVKQGQMEGGEAEIRKRLGLCAALLTKQRLEPYVYVLSEDYSYAQVTSVTTDFELEKNSRGFVHMHAVVVVQHNMFHGIRLTYPKLKADFKKIMRTKGVHLDCQLIRGASDGVQAALQYIRKDVKKPASVE